jgi:hypothetical protein
MNWLIALPLGLIGALAFRIRGGLLEDKHVPGMISRSSWGLACFISAWAGMDLQNIWLALAIGALCFVSTTAGLHNTIDMGKNIDTPAEQKQSVLRRFLRDFAVGHWHGLVLGAAAAVPLAWFHWGCPGLGCRTGAFPLWYLPLIAGAAWAPIYAGATWLVPDWSILHRIQVEGVALGKGGNAPEAAEFLFGFTFVVALFFATGAWQ